MTSPFSNPSHDVQPFRFDDYSPDSGEPLVDDTGKKWRLFFGIILAFLSLVPLAIGSYFFLFKNPRSNVEDNFGFLLWVLGSWLLGGGISLTFLRLRYACIIGFFTPGITFGLLVALYLGFAILSAMGSL